jgi:hypothetical protein
MANTRKPKPTTTGTARKRTSKPASEPQAPKLDTPEWESLSPERLHQLWQMHHPGRPEVRSMMERLYRQRY